MISWTAFSITALLCHCSARYVAMAVRHMVNKDDNDDDDELMMMMMMMMMMVIGQGRRL